MNTKQTNIDGNRWSVSSSDIRSSDCQPSNVASYHGLAMSAKNQTTGKHRKTVEIMEGQASYCSVIAVTVAHHRRQKSMVNHHSRCVCIGNYYGHNVVSFVGWWKVVANSQKLTHDLKMPINSKFCSICHHLAAAWDPQFWELGECKGLGFAPIKSPPTSSQNSQYKVLLYLPPFGRNSMSNFCPIIWPPPFWGQGGLLGRTLYQMKSLRTFLFNF